MDEYMKKYCDQIDKVTLSHDADQTIMDDLLQADGQKEVPYIKRAKRNLSAAAVVAIVIIASSVTVFAGVAIRGTIIKSKNAASKVEGIESVDVGESYYYDLVADDTGEIYVLTSNDDTGELTDHHVIVWKSRDQADTWEEVLSQPDELTEDSELLGGDLREGKAGIEALIIIEEKDNKSEDGYVTRVYQIDADSYVQYDMSEVYAKLGDPSKLYNVKYVNDNTIALVGTKECLLYDTITQKVVKTLSCDLTMGCLLTQDQFLLYGKEIYSCLDANTLEEQEPDKDLQVFVQTMYEKNGQDVFPPMQVQDDTIICVTKTGIYEYQAGEITQMNRLSAAANEGRAFNGLLPVCKGNGGEYYVCVFGDTGMTLWQIDGNREEKID